MKTDIAQDFDLLFLILYLPDFSENKPARAAYQVAALPKVRGVILL